MEISVPHLQVNKYSNMIVFNPLTTLFDCVHIWAYASGGGKAPRIRKAIMSMSYNQVLFDLL